MGQARPRRGGGRGRRRAWGGQGGEAHTRAGGGVHACHTGHAERAFPAAAEGELDPRGLPPRARTLVLAPTAPPFSFLPPLLPLPPVSLCRILAHGLPPLQYTALTAPAEYAARAAGAKPGPAATGEPACQNKGGRSGGEGGRRASRQPRHRVLGGAAATLGGGGGGRGGFRRTFGRRFARRVDVGRRFRRSGRSSQGVCACQSGR